MEWKFEEGRVFATDETGELMAEATFVIKENGEWDIDYTYVSPVLRGQGVAGKMMEVVANYIRKKNAKATATCAYANIWLRQHTESYADIISEDLDGEPITCKVDSSH